MNAAYIELLNMTGLEECIEKLAKVMGDIARGRKDNGRPLAAETSRQMARECLDCLDLEWPKTEVR